MLQKPTQPWLRYGLILGLAMFSFSLKAQSIPNAPVRQQWKFRVHQRSRRQFASAILYAAIAIEHSKINCSRCLKARRESPARFWTAAARNADARYGPILSAGRRRRISTRQAGLLFSDQCSITAKVHPVPAPFNGAACERTAPKHHLQ